MHAVLQRGVGLEVTLADGGRHRDPAVRSTAGWIELGSGRHGSTELPWAWELPVLVDGDGFVVRRLAQTSDDPMWGNYQWVAMLDPVELADGSPCTPESDPSAQDAGCPPALDVRRLDASRRHGRGTWWAEVTPRPEYWPRCSCCPLLFGRVSETIEAKSRGSTLSSRQAGAEYATAYLVALDVETGVCVHVEHLDGDHVGRGFSVDIRAVDDRG